jgi:DNA-binding transcriptional LysR family regulator
VASADPPDQTLPDVRAEVVIDAHLTDIAAEGFDAGVRLGEPVARDMTAEKTGPGIRMAVVCSPDYFAEMGRPWEPAHLIGHRCINIRMPTAGRSIHGNSKRTADRLMCVSMVRLWPWRSRSQKICQMADLSEFWSIGVSPSLATTFMIQTVAIPLPP